MAIYLEAEETTWPPGCAWPTRSTPGQPPGVVGFDPHDDVGFDILLRGDVVSCPELGAMVEVAMDVPGVPGARMTGAGFGGYTVNLVHEDAVDEFRRTVLTRYMCKVNPSRLSLEPQVYVCRAEDGAGLMPLEG